MGIKITIDDRQMKKILGDISKKCRNLEPPLTGWGRKLVEQTRSQFDSESDPEGTKWADLAPTTVLQKRKAGFSSSILTRTGAMRDSVGFDVAAKTLSLKIGTNYAKWHQEGTRRMPQRKILAITPERKNEGAGLVRNYIKGRKNY